MLLNLLSGIFRLLQIVVTVLTVLSEMQPQVSFKPIFAPVLLADPEPLGTSKNCLVKSSFHSLKSSVSGKTHFDFEVVYQRATDLLLKLDSIQGGVRMIRDGKRSLSRDLVRFLEYIDGCAVKRHEISYRAAKNARFGGGCSKSRIWGSKSRVFDLGNKEKMEKLRKRIEKIRVLSNEDEETVQLEGFKQSMNEDEEIPTTYSTNKKDCTSKIKNWVVVKGSGGKSRVKRTVSFDVNGNVYRVYDNTPEPASSGDGDSTDRSNDEIGERTENDYNELEGFKQIIDDGEEIRTIYITNGKSCASKIKNGVLLKGSGRNSRLKKTVSFDVNGNVYRVYGNTPEPNSSGDEDSTHGSNDEKGAGTENRYNEVEEIKCVRKENVDDEEEAHMENEGSSSQGSDGDVKIRLRRNEINRGFCVRKWEFSVFCSTAFKDGTLEPILYKL